MESGCSEGSMWYVFGDYMLDVQRRELRCQGHAVPLRPKVFDLLVYLIRQRDRVVAKQELLTALWPHLYVSPATLSACIKLVRRAVGDSGTTQHCIQTLHGRGYRFVALVEEREPRPPAGHPPPALPPAAPAQGCTPSAPPAREEPPATAALSAPHLPAPDGEYKLVTVLCCELVDTSTVLTCQGPETLYRLHQVMYGLAHEVMQPYAGTLMPPSSEGVTAVFGMPVAQEDHARRAVLAALELQQRVGEHPALRAQRPDGGHAVRMGLHSGLVVVGGFGQNPPQLSTTVGFPIHLARCLQQQAAPGTILLSTATYALVHTEVQATPYGTLAMDGSPTPTLTYRVQGLLRREAGVAGRRPRAQSPFVGRKRELTFLHDCLTTAAAGQGQVVGLVGEPGIGKSRLLTEFCQRLADQPVTVYVGQCLAYCQATAYLPVREVLRQVCGIVESDAPMMSTTVVQGRLHESGLTAAEDVALLEHLLALPVEPERLAPLSPQARQARTFALLRHLVLHAAQRQPLVLAVENLHWSDATSAAWLASLVECLANAAVLLLGTYRPGYQPPWGAQVAVTQVALAPLPARESRVVVQAVLGACQLPEARLRKIVARAAGNPFFLEELAWDTREQGQTATPGVVPETVHAVLAARLDRLPLEAKHLVQTAAVIGQTVPFPLLQAVTAVPEDTLQRSLAHLQAAEFLYETRVVPERTYSFKHVLTQEVAYQSLLASTRQQYHQGIAHVMETRFPETVVMHPALLAHHYAEAGYPAQASPYWQRAGQQAIARSSYVEAIAHFAKGLEGVETLPDTPTRARQELALLSPLIRVLMLTQGYGAPEVARTLTRAQALCQQEEDTTEHFFVQAGLQTVALVRAELQTARGLAERLLQSAWRQPEPLLCAKASIAAGESCLFLGELRAARIHLEEGMGCATSRAHTDFDVCSGGAAVGVVCQATLAWTLWLLGYPAQAVARVQAAYALAEQLAHPASLGYALDFAVGLYQLRREVQTVQERAEALHALACTQEFSQLLAWSTALHGWAYAVQERTTARMAQIGEGLAAWRVTGTALNQPWLLALMAEVYGLAGQTDAGLTLLTEALTLVDNTDERWYEAELYRLEGEILLVHAAAHHTAAETCFRHACDVARRQQAKSWELRAAMSLARLWQQQGKQAEARALLAPVYGWFTEGFDTPDLQEAKGLLETLAG